METIACNIQLPIKDEELFVEGGISLLKSYIHSLAYYLPEGVEYNSPDDKITDKIGISKKHIAADTETASDLAIHAAKRLFEQSGLNTDGIDFLIFCTQSPDYLLPTTACLIQHRLGLSSSCGALDINLGCSGYVYGLSLAKGLIETGLARHVLLLTGDTYSKYVNSRDRSVKVIFGDAASATLISGMESNTDFIGPFIFGTDGGGAQNLIVPAGGLREPLTRESLIEQEDPFGNIRSRANLYMNGPEIFNFTLREIPKTIHSLLEKSGNQLSDYQHFIFHQANQYMLEHLRKKMKIEETKFPIDLVDCGNTVSSTIPIVLKRELDRQKMKENDLLMLVGFGVGYSWAACNLIWKI
jgi:3-oxoacyl-[acyl-carrier-protein] synthase-3